MKRGWRGAPGSVELGGCLKKYRASPRPHNGEQLGGARVEIAAHATDGVELARVDLAVRPQHGVGNVGVDNRAEHHVRARRAIAKVDDASSRHSKATGAAATRGGRTFTDGAAAIANFSNSLSPCGSGEAVRFIGSARAKGTMFTTNSGTSPTLTTAVFFPPVAVHRPR